MPTIVVMQLYVKYWAGQLNTGLQCALSTKFRHQRVNYSIKIKINADWGRRDSTKCIFL